MNTSKIICFLLGLLLIGMLALAFAGSKKRVLLIAPTKYEQELAEKYPYRCYVYPLPNLMGAHYDLQSMLDEICTYAKNNKIDGILSGEDYAGAAMASICSERLGLAGPSPLSILTCQHKYYSRLAQKASVPEATSAFSLGANLPLPCFIKPIKSSFSRYAQKIHTAGEIQVPPPCFFDFFDQLIANATPFAASEERMLAEELLQGQQVTWEGYICDGEVHSFGIVDSIMYPGTISFQRFEYPSQLPQSVQLRIETICKNVLKFVTLDNTLCNIEFMYDKDCDRISIIEINPRYALQFCDLYEKVDGTNSYEVALALTTGLKPKIQKNAGNYKIAASFVLRHFVDGTVEKVPTDEEIANVKRRFPDALVFVDYKPGQKLSDILQDGTSFRYGLIHLGGHDREDLFERFEECKNALTFTIRS